MYTAASAKSKMLLLLLVVVKCTQTLTAQTIVPLQDLSFFQPASPNWKLSGSVNADLLQDNLLTTKDGSGVLINIPGQGAKDLYTKSSYGDMDIELDFMMAKKSNSGVYFMGRYEVQIFDSWGVINPISGDNGGVYERWDDNRPTGTKGYEGTAPRQNASKAPGLWQHLKVSFQAPRFNEQGTKISNAKMLNVWLNGVLVQENVEVTGPTRGGIADEKESASPLRLQGDHGPVAFRNITISNFDKPHPVLENLKFAVYDGAFATEPDYNKLKGSATGNSQIVSPDRGKLSNNFLIRYTGSLEVKQAGDYTFKLNAPGGKAALSIKGQHIIPFTENNSTGKITLTQGGNEFELVYAKTVEWLKPAIGLTITGPGIREYLLSDANAASGNSPIDPVLISAAQDPILRSFTDIPGASRLIHAVNVGSAEEVHYTYDMDKGMIVQVWHGSFLNATPMWHERGDGSSHPAGSVVYLGKPLLFLAKLDNAQAPWPQDTVASGFQPKGYKVNANDQPTFRYRLYGCMINDAATPIEGGKGIHREIAVDSTTGNLYALLAQGREIEMLNDHLYLVDDKSYYIRLDDPDTDKPVVRKFGNRQELIVPVKQKLSYSIIF